MYTKKLIIGLLILFIIYFILKILDYNSKKKSALVIQHYNSQKNLNYLLKKYSHKFKRVFIVSHSEISDNIIRDYNNCEVLYRNNTGREYGAYLYFIINKYDRLGDYNYIYFINCSLEKHHRINRINRMCNWLINEHNVTYFYNKNRLSIVPFIRIKDEYNFTINSYDNTPLSKAKYSPLNNFLEHYFGKNINLDSIISYNGLIIGDSTSILKNDISLYIDLLKEVNYDNTNEAVHFLERLFHLLVQ